MANDYPLKKQLAVEFLGTMILVCTVVGSGIMGDALSTDDAVALLGNTIPTGAILFVIISLFAPISGAHFNPIVTMIFMIKKDLPHKTAGQYIIMQILGAVIGVLIAHMMFELPIVTLSEKARTGQGQWISEIVASFGLILTILLGIKFQPNQIPALVGFYITAAYWFTASTSFANPAVAIARGLTNSFSGIRPNDVPMFILAEIIGAILAYIFVNWLINEKN